VKLKADLHIHTVLSPCGDLEMSPSAIVAKAADIGLNIIGITDHNSTLNALVTRDIGLEKGILVLTGAEVTTKEEVHCLCFMPDDDSLAKFQSFIDSRLVFYPNDPSRFGFQVIVDKDENITGEVPHLLINAIDCSLSELQDKVSELKGIFIPAHVDRTNYSLSSQLGFIPDDLKFDALELSAYYEKNNFFGNFPWFSGYNYIRSSDAHFINDIGKVYTGMELEKAGFEYIRKALAGDSLNYLIK